MEQVEHNNIGAPFVSHCFFSSLKIGQKVNFDFINSRMSKRDQNYRLENSQISKLGSASMIVQHKQ